MDDVYAINLAKTRIREGYENEDVDAILSVYDDSFTDMSASYPSFYDTDSKKVFRAKLTRLFSEYLAQLTTIIITVSVFGDRALDRGWNVLTLTSKTTGRTLEVRTRYFQVWRRDFVRGWVITSFIDNLDQSPMLPDDLIAQIQNSTTSSIVTRSQGDHS